MIFTLLIFHILVLSLSYYYIRFVGSSSHYVPGFGGEFVRVCWSFVNCLGIDGFWVHMLFVWCICLKKHRSWHPKYKSIQKKNNHTTKLSYTGWDCFPSHRQCTLNHYLHYFLPSLIRLHVCGWAQGTTSLVAQMQ